MQLSKWWGISALAFITAQPVMAQDGSGERFSDLLMEEVIVTARKREESLQDTPISITAFTTAGLEARHITDIEEIGELTPNLVFDRVAPVSGSNSAAVVYIRGIGQDTIIPTIDLGVGVYLDGVYLARAVGGIVDLVDVERVEVLRGPQGTLFGRNTIGGAISITTKKPHDEFEGHASVTVGSDEQIDAQATVNAPLTDNFFAKVSLGTDNREGYVFRPDGTDLGEEDALMGRVALRWLATDRLEFNLAFDGTRRRENGAPYVLTRVEETAAFPSFHNGAIAGPPCVPPPGSLTNPACFNGQWLPSDPRLEQGTVDANDELDLWGVAFTVDLDLDWAEFKSITSYRDTESVFSFDQDHTPIDIAAVDSIFNQDQFSQEVQLLGDSFDDRLHWIFGLYYFTEQADNFERVTFPIVFFQSGGSVNNDSYAAFSQLTYDLTDRLSLTGGLRYTKDVKRFTPVQHIFSSVIGLPPGTPILPNVEARLKITETSPMVNLSYHWTDDVMTYVTYSEGFKSGGFTPRVFPPIFPAPGQNPSEVIPRFQPEYVEVWEAGFKFSGFNNRMRLNGAVFTTDYTDLQFTVQDVTVAPVVRNAGAASIDGFELELIVAPLPGLTLEGAVGHLDNRITQVDPGTGVSPGDRLVRAPKWSYNAGLSYEFLLGNRGSITPRLDWSYRSGIYYNAINSADLYQDGYHRLDAAIAYRSADDLWMVSLLGKNLTGERYIQSGFSDPVNLGITEIVYSRKAEWALSVRRRF